MLDRCVIVLAAFAASCSLDWSYPNGTGGGGGASSATSAAGHDGMDPRCCSVCRPLPATCSTDHFIDAVLDSSCDGVGWAFESGPGCFPLRTCGACDSCGELPDSEAGCNELISTVCGDCAFD